MGDIEKQHLEVPPPRPSHVAPVSPALDTVVLRCMEKQADRRFPTARAFVDALRQAVGSSRIDIPEVSARAVAIYVEVRMGEGGDSDDEILDDGSAVLDVAEHSMREAGLALPLQTGCALVAAKILSDDTQQAARERSQIVEIANNLAREIAQRPNAHPDVHVNVCVHVDRAVVRESAEVPGGREIIGGEIISTGVWAPQGNVSGVLLIPEPAHR
jgi:serine/threonine-protein kinase